MSIDMNRKQFLGTVFATIASSCIPLFGDVGKSEFDKCKDDILYFVDNYLVVNDPLYGKLKMTPQQREYLKRISIAPDYFFCAKGRQTGISTANNVFAYWKNLFFPGHKVWIVEPNMVMAKRVGELFANVSNTGGFQLDPDRIHFVSPHALTCVNWHDRTNTFILDEFAFWGKGCLDKETWRELNANLSNPAFAKVTPQLFEKCACNFIVPSTPQSPYDSFMLRISEVDNSRRMKIPSPMRGLEA